MRQVRVPNVRFPLQMGHLVFPPEGLHAGLHHWARLRRQSQQWFQEARCQDDRPVHRQCWGSQQMEQGSGHTGRMLLFNLYSVSEVKDNWTSEASGRWVECHSERSVLRSDNCCTTLLFQQPRFARYLKTPTSVSSDIFITNIILPLHFCNLFLIFVVAVL